MIQICTSDRDVFLLDLFAFVSPPDGLHQLLPSNEFVGFAFSWCSDYLDIHRYFTAKIPAYAKNDLVNVATHELVFEECATIIDIKDLHEILFFRMNDADFYSLYAVLMSNRNFATKGYCLLAFTFECTGIFLDQSFEVEVCSVTCHCVISNTQCQRTSSCSIRCNTMFVLTPINTAASSQGLFEHRQTSQS